MAYGYIIEFAITLVWSEYSWFANGQPGEPVQDCQVMSDTMLYVHCLELSGRHAGNSHESSNETAVYIWSSNLNTVPQVFQCFVRGPFS